MELSFREWGLKLGKLIHGFSLESHDSQCRADLTHFQYTRFD